MATQVIQRANNSSNLYANIKARGSNSGPAGCGYIYASEVNQCPCWRHKVKVTPQNSPGYDRTVRFELPNYGFLEHVFLETLFSANAGMTTGTDGNDVDTALCWGAGAFIFSEVRLVFRGQEVARLTSDYIVMRHLQDLSEERLDNFLDMIGGFPVGDTNTGGGGASNRKGRYKLKTATSNQHGQYEMVEVELGTFLYDLEADPGETQDVKAGHPEVLRDLKAVHRAWTAALKR